MNDQTDLRRPVSDSKILVEGEYPFTQEDFRTIAAMLIEDAGIALPDSKATLAYSRLAKRLRALGLKNFKDYCALIASPNGVDERRKMLASLTTNVTRFFREPHHFEHLKTRVLPDLLAHAKRGGRVRIWSAGCSTGQEPYTIALTLLSLLPDAGRYDIKILASDIDPNVVAEGRAGFYDEESCAPIPRDMMKRWFVPNPADTFKCWSVGEAMRELVSFRELNLMGQWPMKGPFDVIFCRNVVIYFEEQTQAKIWGRYAPLLTPGGRLYIGHSERVSGPATSQFQTDGLTTYRLAGAAS